MCHANYRMLIPGSKFISLNNMGQDTYYIGVYQIRMLYIIYEVINEAKLLWPTVVCKVGQTNPELMKL